MSNPANDMMYDCPTLERRTEVFAAVLASQDGGASFRTSRYLMAKRFGLPVEDVERIEREGLDRGGWRWASRPVTGRPRFT